MHGINWKLLNRQKEELLQVANNGHPNLHGIVHLLDSLQDDAVDNQGPSEKEGFGSSEYPITSRPLTLEDLDERFGLEDARPSVPFQIEIEGEDVHWLDTATVEITMLRVYWKILHAVQVANGGPIFDLISKELSVAMDKKARKIFNIKRDSHEIPV